MDLRTVCQLFEWTAFSHDQNASSDNAWTFQLVAVFPSRITMGTLRISIVRRFRHVLERPDSESPESQVRLATMLIDPLLWQPRNSAGPCAMAANEESS